VIWRRGGAPAAASPAGPRDTAGADPATAAVAETAAGRPESAGLDSSGPGSAGPDSAGRGTVTAVAAGPDAAGTTGGPRRRRTDPWKTAFFALAAVAILAGAAWALLGSKFFVVRSVQVTGLAGISRAEVIADAGIRLGTPLIRIDPGVVARRVEQITLVQSAGVRRAWPDKVVISVQERTAVFAVASGRGYQLIDKFGVGLRQVARRPPGMPVLGQPHPASTAALRGSPEVLAAANVLRELPARLARRVRAVDAPAADDVTLRLSRGVRITWGGTGQAAAKSRELAILMRGHARYYDVSDPRTAVTGR
jgi:cell division protein FtsQ